MRRRFYFLFWTLLLIIGIPWCADATHIVGGEVTYKCLGQDAAGNNQYEVTINIYQDCVTGDINAITQDSPAYISIFNGQGARLISDSLHRTGDNLRVPANFSNSCVNNPPRTCLNKISFTKVYVLSPNTTGYYFVYQRCCRNYSILNIATPEQVGATYYAFIPPYTLGIGRCNNSAVFKDYPPQIICINNPIIYDNSATDAGW